jgi:hypothetical protein
MAPKRDSRKPAFRLFASLSRRTTTKSASDTGLPAGVGEKAPTQLAEETPAEVREKPTPDVNFIEVEPTAREVAKPKKTKHSVPRQRKRKRPPSKDGTTHENRTNTEEYS